MDKVEKLARLLCKTITTWEPDILAYPGEMPAVRVFGAVAYVVGSQEPVALWRMFSYLAADVLAAGYVPPAEPDSLDAAPDPVDPPSEMQPNADFEPIASQDTAWRERAGLDVTSF